MTEPTTDARPTDTIRDAFEAMLWFLACVIGPLRSRKITPAEEIGALAACEVETDFEPDEPPAPLLALRDIIQRAAEEHAHPLRIVYAGADWTPERIREARERCDKATPGPWTATALAHDERPDTNDVCDMVNGVYVVSRSDLALFEHDAAFIAHAREDLPAALAWGEQQTRIAAGNAALEASQRAEIERLTAELAARAPAERPSIDDCPGCAKVRRKAAQGERYGCALHPAAPADASLEAAERTWRGEWQRIAADIRSMSEAGKTPADILAILLTHLDRMKPLAVVRAADASRPVLTEEQARKMARAAITEARHAGIAANGEAARLRIQEQAAISRMINEAEEVVHAAALLRISRGSTALTEAQADELEGLLESIESAVVGGWTLPNGVHAIIKSDDGHLSVIQSAQHRSWIVKLREILRASRGETGPAHPLEWTCPKCGQRAVGLGARQSPELGCERCGHVERPAADLGPGIGGVPIRVRPTAAPDPLALDPEDGTLCADCRAPRNTIHGALCSVRAGAKPGRVPDPRATLHAGDPERPDPRVDYSDGMRPAVLGGECAECLHAPPLHERTCSKLARRPQ